MSSLDLLYLVLALSVATLTFFLSRLLYYVIGIVRDLRETSREIRDKVEAIGKVLEAIKQKMSDSASTLSLLTQVISKLLKRWTERQAKRPSKNSSS